MAKQQEVKTYSPSLAARAGYRHLPVVLRGPKASVESRVTTDLGLRGCAACV